jgi:threonine/homoserine/homoserine lactone efflux protein
MLALGALTAGSLVILALLVTALLVHGGLLAAVAAALLAILAAGVAGAAALVWLARRLWRRHAWTEAMPPAAGPSWQSLAARAARLLFSGRALWRLRTRLASRA